MINNYAICPICYQIVTWEGRKIPDYVIKVKPRRGPSRYYHVECYMNEYKQNQKEATK